MSKNITVHIAGSGELRDATILPGTTVREVLNSLELGGYKLAKINEPPFGDDENIYTLVDDGMKLAASTKAEVAWGAETASLCLISYYAILTAVMHNRKKKKRMEKPAMVMENTAVTSLSEGLPPERIPVGSRQRTIVRREKIPYWQERGWKKDGKNYTGYYRTMYESKKGVVVGRLGSFEFYIFEPPPQLWKHPHINCFGHKGGKKYSIHFGVRALDVSSGIIEVERILNEAYRIV